MAKKFTGKRGKVKARKTYKFMNTVHVAPKYRLVDEDLDIQLDYLADKAVLESTMRTGIWQTFFNARKGYEVNKNVKVSAAALHVAKEVAEKTEKPLSWVLKTWADFGEVVIPTRYMEEYGQEVANMAELLKQKYVDRMVLDELVDVTEYAENTFDSPEQAVMFMYGLSDVEPTEADWDVAEQDWDHHNTTIEGTALCQVVRKIVDEFDSQYAADIFDNKWSIKSLRESIGKNSDEIMKILDEAEELIKEQRR